MPSETSVRKHGLGLNTFQIPVSLYEENRKRLVKELQHQTKSAVVLLQGGSETPIYDSDISYLFRQESYFTWAFGVLEPDAYGAIAVDSGETYLFFTKLPDVYVIWCGPIPVLDELKNKYGVDHVYYVDQLDDVLNKLNKEVILTLKGTNSDSGLTAKEASFNGIEKYKVDNKILFPVIANLRVFKTNQELGVLRYVIDISSAAHRHVMRVAKPDWYEYQCESEFKNYCYKIGGCRHVSYPCICGSGSNASICHYGHAGAPNYRQIKDGDLCLFDMGANYYGFTSDITVTFPINGKFTTDQKIIYEAVLAANQVVFKEGKPGVSYRDMHLLSNRVLLEKLKEGGLIQGSVDEMMEADLAAVFQPHGLGHFMGLDVHDVGGYLEGHPERSDRPGLRNLRTARVLKENMVLTIEPGCYFIDPLLDAALKDPKQSKFLVPTVLSRFRGFGGVRIEDDVLVTKDGIVNLTKVPRTVQEVEDYMAGKNDELYL